MIADRTGETDEKRMESTFMITERYERRTFLLTSLAASCAILGRTRLAHANRAEIGADEVIRMVPPRAGHDAPVVTAVSLHPDRQWIAAGGDDHVVRVWDRRQKAVIRTLDRHRDWVRSVMFSPNGDSLATAAADGKAYIWHRQSERPGEPVIARPHPLNGLTYTPDGKFLVVVGFRCELILYEIATGRVATTWECPCLDMRSVAVSPDSQWIAAGGRNGIVRVWDYSRRTKQIDIAAHKQRIRTVLFDVEASRLLTAGEDRMIYAFDLRTGSQIYAVTNKSAKILSLQLLGTNQVAAAGSDNVIRVYNLDTGVLEMELTGHTGSVAALSRQGDLLASGSYDTTVRVWNVAALNSSPGRTIVPNQELTDLSGNTEVR